jgi:hypothetical protein
LSAWNSWCSGDSSSLAYRFIGSRSLCLKLACFVTGAVQRCSGGQADDSGKFAF